MKKECAHIMAKPDDRSDNVDKLQNMIANTMENVRESRDYMKAHADEMSSEQKAEMQVKNERREESIEAFRSEVQDEAHK